MAKVTPRKLPSKARERSERLLNRGTLANVIVGQVNVIAESVARESNPTRRARLALPLLRTYELLQPKWSMSTLRIEVARAFEIPADCLSRGAWSEQTAVNRAIEQIGNALNDMYAPEEYAMAKPDRALVLDCLRAAPGTRGRPRGKQISRARALNALLKQLGISGATPEAVSRMLRRRSR